MANLALERTAPDRQAVALKAFARIADAWSLTLREAAYLADMSESTWKRARKPGFAGDLTRDQMLRLSGLIGLYKSLGLYFNQPISAEWVRLPNRGPEFDGARPVDAMIAARPAKDPAGEGVSRRAQGWRLRITPVKDRALIRLISDTHHKPPVLRGLVDSKEEAAILAEIEGETSARLIAEREGSAALDRRELAFARRSHDLKLFGQSHINAAFTYTRPTGNRFNSGDRGAWYCAWDMLTSAQEVGFHRTRELEFINRYEDEARYVELLADFIGDFPDLHGVAYPALDPENAHPALNPEPAIGYPAGQALAADLRREGHRGLIYPSVRHEGGRCFVAFDPGIIQNVRPGASWKLVWSGAPEFTITGL